MLILQQLLIERRAGGDNLNNLALHNALGKARVLHLLANSNAIALLHKLSDIPIHAVIGHAAHGDIIAIASALGEGNIQFTGRREGILKKHFVKISQAKEEQFILMLLLHSQVLLYHRCIIGSVIIFSSH